MRLRIVNLNQVRFRKAGEKMEVTNEEMTTKELSLAAEWLRAHGHTDEEIIDFLDFIAQRHVKAKKEESETKE